MAVNLVDLVQNHLTGPVMRQFGSLLGESEAATQSAVGLAVPATIGALMKQASTPSGASMLSSLLDKADTSMLGSLASSLGGGAKSLLDSGSNLVRSLFGSQANAVSDGVSRATGMGKDKITKLLALIVPIVIGVLAREKRDKGLDTAGITNLLGGQKSFLSGLLPAGLSDTLGITDLIGATGAKARAAADRAGEYAVRTADYAADTGRAAVRTTARAAEEGTSILRKLLPLAALALLGLILWSWLAGRSGSKVDAAPRVEDAGAGVGAVQTELTGYIDSATAALRNITDVESAKAAIPKLQAATKGVNTLSTTLSSLTSAARSSVSSAASTAITSLQALADKALALPGVSDVLKPTVTGLMDALGKLRA